jgi:hypothetical protein
VEDLVAVHILLLMAGLAGLGLGLVLLRRLVRWSPRVSPDLTEYDPGPDFLDWLPALSLVVASSAMLIVVTVV